MIRLNCVSPRGVHLIELDSLGVTDNVINFRLRCRVGPGALELCLVVPGIFYLKLSDVDQVLHLLAIRITHATDLSQCTVCHWR